jgi:hypothetical protein
MPLYNTRLSTIYDIKKRKDQLQQYNNWNGYFFVWWNKNNRQVHILWGQ